MRIAIMAAGAVGAYYGARLAAAGHDVVFFARGRNLDAMSRNGLTVKSPLGDVILPAVNVTDDPSTVAPADIVLFAVKLWDTEKAARQIKPIVTQDTRVITLQNGVDSVETLVPILGADQVIGGMTVISTVISEPGVIVHSGQLAMIRCGRVDNRPDAKLEAFVAAAKAAGIDIAVSDDMQRDRWAKFVPLVAMSGMTALTRKTLGEVLDDQDTAAMFRAILDEVTALGRASGANLAADFAADRFEFMKKMPSTMKASMAHDLERGNRLELDWLAGRAVELGRALGVATPANAAVYAALKLHRFGISH